MSEKNVRFEQEYNFIKAQADQGSNLFKCYHSTMVILDSLGWIEHQFHQFNNAMAAIVRGESEQSHGQTIAICIDEMSKSCGVITKLSCMFTDKRLFKSCKKLNHHLLRYTECIIKILDGNQVKRFGDRYQKPLDKAIVDILKHIKPVEEFKNEVKLEILR